MAKIIAKAIGNKIGLPNIKTAIINAIIIKVLAVLEKFSSSLINYHLPTLKTLLVCANNIRYGFKLLQCNEIIVILYIM
jgi:hypothetical protein